MGLFFFSPWDKAPEGVWLYSEAVNDEGKMSKCKSQVGKFAKFITKVSRHLFFVFATDLFFSP